MRLGTASAKLIAALGLVVGGVAVAVGPASADTGAPGPAGHALYVSHQAADHDGDQDGSGCDDAQYRTIVGAVTAAHPGDTVVVCPGTYGQDVVVNKPLTLIGHDATIDAAGLNNGIQVVSSNVTVQGFTITKAIGEGILVGLDSQSDPSFGFVESNGFLISHVAVIDNDVVNDNQGFSGPGGSTSTCVYGGDCGGGIHFNVVSHSTLSGNHVSRNADGILLTDDYGPAFDNVIANNWVVDNATECGITLPSHSSDAVTFNPTTMQVTGTNPSKGGVYDNKVIDNVANDNGTVIATEGPGVVTGSGAGVGIFGSGPGSGAYDNLIQGNELNGNGLAGVTIHAHVPGGEDVSGNQIVQNTIGTNNIGGDPEDGPGFPSDPLTTGISIFSAVAALQITIAGNHISSNKVGIWFTKSTVTAHGLASNSFSQVTTPILGA